MSTKTEPVRRLRSANKRNKKRTRPIPGTSAFVDAIRGTTLVQSAQSKLHLIVPITPGGGTDYLPGLSWLSPASSEVNSAFVCCPGSQSTACGSLSRPVRFALVRKLHIHGLSSSSLLSNIRFGPYYAASFGCCQAIDYPEMDW